MAFLPVFNFARLLEDLAVEHNMLPPVFLPAVHPWPDHVAVLCSYAGVNALGGGQSDIEARIAAARQVWIGLGHLITIDPRYFSIILLAFENYFASAVSHAASWSFS
jgi:hypothetical protein